jgi:DNA-binding XRE family transcriptional regulator
VKVTAAQIRAARALLDWKQDDLADQIGLTKFSISKIERGETDGSVQTQQKILEVFTRAGVEFIDGGVRPTQSTITIHRGMEGFCAFFDDVYEVILRSCGCLHYQCRRIRI